MKKVFLLILVITCMCDFNLLGQVSVKDSAVFAPIIDFSYGYKMPGNDLEKRFGNHSELGIAFFIKNRKNFLFGVDWNYMFGDEVKELEFADQFRDDKGGILANNGLYSEIYFVERGFTLSPKLGKIFDLLAVNPNSGIMVVAGVGFMQHRIQFDVTHSNHIWLNFATNAWYCNAQRNMKQGLFEIAKQIHI